LVPSGGGRPFADPDFQKEIQSEQSEKLVDKIDAMYLDPTAYSSMK